MPRMTSVEARRRKFSRRLQLETLEARQLMTAVPLGALPYDTGEFLLGRVAVTPVLLESNGQIDPSTEDWTSEEIAQVLQNVSTGMQWWVDTLEALDTVHSLEFVIDDTFATTPQETPYEPITRQSNAYPQYVGQFLIDQGFDGSTLTLDDAIREFNNSQREKLNTDWAFTIFVVDSSADADGMFEPSGDFRQAFAFAGGLFFVTPSTRPASTYAHETGHMFWARDEYPNSGNYNDRRGYYNTQNTNAVDGAPPGFQQQASIMSAGTVLQQAYVNNISAASTLAQIGWQDSDQNGIFDVLDVPLNLELVTAFNSQEQILRMRGSATAVPLINRNSSGLQNDITLNEISRIEYRVDGGDWITALTPNSQSVDISLDLNLSDALLGSTPSLIELRAIDNGVGITSNIIEVVPNRPSSGIPTGIDGFAFVDTNDDLSWGQNEDLLSGVILSLASTDGIFSGRLEPDDAADEIYSNPLSGLEISAVGNQVDGRVGSFSGTPSTGDYNFHYATVFGNWGDSWTRIKQELNIRLDQTTTQVSIVAIGKDSDSIARLEAYDESGELISRTTSDALASGQSVTLQLFDPDGRIRSIRAFGTAGTSVSLDDFRYGPATTTVSDVFGTFHFKGLPDGEYTMDVESPSSQFVITNEQITVEVVDGVAQPLVIAATRNASPWTNPVEPLDVNGKNGIEPLDALVIINQLNRTGPRLLTDQDGTPPYLDVNGDWNLSPVDALRIINYLNRNASGEGESGESPRSSSARSSHTGNDVNGINDLSGALPAAATFSSGGQGFAEGEQVAGLVFGPQLNEHNVDEILSKESSRTLLTSRALASNSDSLFQPATASETAANLDADEQPSEPLQQRKDPLYLFCQMSDLKNFSEPSENFRF